MLQEEVKLCKFMLEIQYFTMHDCSVIAKISNQQQCVEFVKSWPTGPYPGTAERAGGETSRGSTN